MLMFLWNNQLLTTRQFHSKSKIFTLLPPVCLFIDFSEYQFLPLRKAKFLKDRREEILHWTQNPFSFWNEQAELQTPFAYHAPAPAGKQDQGLCACENHGAELATHFPSPKFPHGGCAWPSRIHCLNARYDGSPMPHACKSSSSPLVETRHVRRKRKTQRTIIDLCRVSDAGKTWSKFLIPLSRKEEKHLS